MGIDPYITLCSVYACKLQMSRILCAFVACIWSRKLWNYCWSTIAYTDSCWCLESQCSAHTYRIYTQCAHEPCEYNCIPCALYSTGKASIISSIRHELKLPTCIYESEICQNLCQCACCCMCTCLCWFSASLGYHWGIHILIFALLILQPWCEINYKQ